MNGIYGTVALRKEKNITIPHDYIGRPYISIYDSNDTTMHPRNYHSFDNRTKRERTGSRVFQWV